MGYELSDSQLKGELQALFSSGACGMADDFYKWVRMEIRRKFREFPDLTIERTSAFLTDMIASGEIEADKFGAGEFRSAKINGVKKSPGSGRDQYQFIGEIEFSPMQFVRSRLESFLKNNNVPEDKILDISIGTVEAVENAVKYGNGEMVEVKYSVSRNGSFEIEMINKIGKSSIADDIERGKFSETTTLMRGMMVMQKLFDEMDLDIREGESVVRFSAKKNVK